MLHVAGDYFRRMGDYLQLAQIEPTCRYQWPDGTEFNAEAVCFNFDRWYNFKGLQQSPSIAYYWTTVFGGFAQKYYEETYATPSADALRIERFLRRGRRGRRCWRCGVVSQSGHRRA